MIQGSRAKVWENATVSQKYKVCFREQCKYLGTLGEEPNRGAEQRFEYYRPCADWVT